MFLDEACRINKKGSYFGKNLHLPYVVQIPYISNGLSHLSNSRENKRGDGRKLKIRSLLNKFVKS